MGNPYVLDGFYLDGLQFDGKDNERFKDNKEYKAMAEWMTVGDSASDTWDKKEPIQGVYVSKQTNVGPNESNMYNIKTDKGTVGVWGSTVIDSKFEQVPQGAEVRIKSLGMATGKSGKEYADYEFQYREVPMTEVNSPQANEAKVDDIFGD